MTPRCLITSSLVIPVLLLLPYSGMQGQNSNIDVSKHLTYQQAVTPHILDNYLFSTYHASDKRAYNLKGSDIAKPGGHIIDFKVNPAGISYAVVITDGKRNVLRIYESYTPNSEIFNDENMLNPVSIASCPDIRSLYVADIYSTIKQFDLRTIERIATILWLTVDSIPPNQIDRLSYMIGHSDSPVKIIYHPSKWWQLKRSEGKVMNLNQNCAKLILSNDFFGSTKIGVLLSIWNERNSEIREAPHIEVVMELTHSLQL